MNFFDRTPDDEPLRDSGKLTPAEIRELVSRIQGESRHAVPVRPQAHPAPLAADRNTPADLLDQYFDGELGEVGKAALSGHMERDAGLRATRDQTRHLLKLLRATPVVVDRTEAILAEVDQRRRFTRRSTRIKVWGARAALAASLALAVGTAIWLDRVYPGILHDSGPAPLTALENAGRSDAAESVASAVDATKGVVNAVAQPFTDGHPRAIADATGSNRPRKASTKLALGSKSGGPRHTWSPVGGDEITSASGSGRVLIERAHAAAWAQANVVQAGYTPALPDVRVLRCNWESDSALRARDSAADGMSSQGSCENSWWLRAWIQSSSGYTPVAWSPQR